ncbi:unnamed protein product, partial [Heterosigma akashiwo]
DHGVGISPERQKTLFTPFHQVNAHNVAVGRGDLGSGTGLGLSIVKHLVELHRG